MTDLLVYGGIALVVLGCLIVIVGAVKYAAVRKSGAQLNNSREAARLRFAKCRLAWMILSLVGVLLIFLASAVS